MSPARDELVARVSGNLASVRSRIEQAGRNPSDVVIVAVTKAFDLSATEAALACGLSDVGENYAADLVAKHDAASSAECTWHYLGALQRNKLAKLAGRADVYQAVTSRREATSLASHVPDARCYVEVNVTGNEMRAGCRYEQLDDVVAAVRDAGLRLEGLMCVASPSREAAPGEFAGLRHHADRLGIAGCSMGMSGDFDLACAAGSTMVRLGTALFGPRPRGRVADSA